MIRTTKPNKSWKCLVLIMCSIPAFTLVAQTSLTNVMAEISGKVWQDSEPEVNHVLDAGDTVLPGIRVSLLDGDGGSLATVSTDSSGCYVFSYLVEGSYQVMFEIPNNLAFVHPFEGEDKLLDSDVTDVVNGRTDVFFLGAEESASGINAGTRFKTLALADRNLTAYWDPEKVSTILSWDHSINAVAQLIRIYRMEDDTGERLLVATLQKNDEASWMQTVSFEDVEIGTEGDYYYQLEWSTGDGSLYISRIAAIRVQMTFGFPPPLVTFPNPSQDHLVARVRIEKTQNVSFILYDLSGRPAHIWKGQLLDKGQHSLKLDLSVIPEGQYILEAIFGQQRYLQSLVVY